MSLKWLTIKRTTLHIGFVVCIVLLVGCGMTSMVTRLWKDVIELDSVHISSDSDVNAYSAVMIDIAFVLKSELAAELPDNAPDWFNNKPGYLLKMGNDLLVVNIQVPPNYPVTQIDLPKGYKNAYRAVLFGNYLNQKAQAPVDLSAFSDALLVLKKNSIDVKENNS